MGGLANLKIMEAAENERPKAIEFYQPELVGIRRPLSPRRTRRTGAVLAQWVRAVFSFDMATLAVTVTSLTLFFYAIHTPSNPPKSRTNTSDVRGRPNSTPRTDTVDGQTPWLREESAMNPTVKDTEDCLRYGLGAYRRGKMVIRVLRLGEEFENVWRVQCLAAVPAHQGILEIRLDDTLLLQQTYLIEPDICRSLGNCYVNNDHAVSLDETSVSHSVVFRDLEAGTYQCRLTIPECNIDIHSPEFVTYPNPVKTADSRSWGWRLGPTRLSCVPPRTEEGTYVVRWYFDRGESWDRVESDWTTGPVCPAHFISTQRSVSRRGVYLCGHVPPDTENPLGLAYLEVSPTVTELGTYYCEFERRFDGKIFQGSTVLAPWSGFYRTDPLTANCVFEVDVFRDTVISLTDGKNRSWTLDMTTVTPKRVLHVRAPLIYPVTFVARQQINGARVTLAYGAQRLTTFRVRAPTPMYYPFRCSIAPRGGRVYTGTTYIEAHTVEDRKPPGPPDSENTTSGDGALD